jgi:hypothetical protein
VIAQQVVAENNHGAGRMCAELLACSTVGVFDRATCSKNKGCGVDTSLDMKRELSISFGSGPGSAGREVPELMGAVVVIATMVTQLALQSLK